MCRGGTGDGFRHGVASFPRVGGVLLMRAPGGAVETDPPGVLPGISGRYAASLRSLNQ
ncbi:hypothetical protein GCM10022232_07090 [Streptomyces plumbiresistens]|uniref:Uncharacterized protein n=1 Tax=Streptomyces plumbiresistens TaxID=511811 RepID=A0ABP7Q856_9ACTN